MLSQNQIGIITNSFSQLATNTNFVEIVNINFSVTANNNFNYNGRNIKALTNIYSGRRVLLFQDTNTRQYYAVGEDFNPVLSERTFTRKTNYEKTSLIRNLAPKYAVDGGVAFSINNIAKIPGSTVGIFQPPKKYNGVHYISTQKSQALKDFKYVLWWAIGPFAAFYLDQVYIYPAFDNDGWAVIGGEDNFEPWSGESGTRWGIPFHFSKDGIKWTTPYKDGDYYALTLGVNATEYDKDSAATSLFAFTGIVCTWSQDYSTIYARCSDGIDAYIVTSDFSNALNYESLGAFYWYSLDRGVTWKSGISKENQLNYYNFGFSLPAYKNNTVYTGVMDRARPSMTFQTALNTATGMIQNSNAITVTSTLSEEMIGYKFKILFSDSSYSGDYTITNISSNGRTISLTPPINIPKGKTPSRVYFPMRLLKTNYKKLNDTEGLLITKHDLLSNTFSGELTWPYPTNLQDKRNSNINLVFACDYLPIEDDFLQTFHNASDPHFAPLFVFVQMLQWTGQNRVIALLYGKNWLYPYVVGSQQNRIPPDPDVPNWAPFNKTYSNWYRFINTSPKYLFVEEGVEQPSISNYTSSVIGLWEDSSEVIYKFPEEIFLDGLEEQDGFWQVKYKVPFSYPTTDAICAGNSTFLVLKVESTTNNKGALVVSYDGRTFTLIPNSDLNFSNVLGYDHSSAIPVFGGIISDVYGFIWYEPLNDTVNVFYGAYAADSIAYLFHSYSNDGVNWVTKKKERIPSPNSAKDYRPFLGDRLPDKLGSKGLATPKIL